MWPGLNTSSSSGFEAEAAPPPPRPPLSTPPPPHPSTRQPQNLYVYPFIGLFTYVVKYFVYVMCVYIRYEHVRLYSYTYTCICSYVGMYVCTWKGEHAFPQKLSRKREPHIKVVCQLTRRKDFFAAWEEVCMYVCMYVSVYLSVCLYVWACCDKPAFV